MMPSKINGLAGQVFRGLTVLVKMPFRVETIATDVSEGKATMKEHERKADIRFEGIAGQQRVHEKSQSDRHSDVTAAIAAVRKEVAGYAGKVEGLIAGLGIKLPAPPEAPPPPEPPGPPGP